MRNLGLSAPLLLIFALLAAIAWLEIGARSRDASSGPVVTSAHVNAASTPPSAGLSAPRFPPLSAVTVRAADDLPDGRTQAAASEPDASDPVSAHLSSDNGLSSSASVPVPRTSSFEPPVFSQLRDHWSKPIPECVRTLSAEVTKDCTNEVTKARAIYDWITANIRYDTSEWKNIVSGADGYIHEHDPATVLSRGTTVCIGYAWLFDDMCKSAGIESTYLIGDVRGYRGTEDDKLVSKVKHAWSAVRTDDGWKLLDATWGARQDGEAESDAKMRADYYYDTPAEQFVYDHLPENEEWQLLDPAIPTQLAFKVLPNLKPAFFTDGLTLGADYSSVMVGESGKSYRLSFGKPEGTDVAFTLGAVTDGEKSVQLRTVNSASGRAAAVALPELPSGDHLLRVYSRKGDGAFSCAADFVLHID